MRNAGCGLTFVRTMSKRRNQAEKHSKPNHGGAWEKHRAARKAHRKTAIFAKRARRRLDTAIVEEALAGMERKSPIKFAFINTRS